MRKIFQQKQEGPGRGILDLKEDATKFQSVSIELSADQTIPIHLKAKSDNIIILEESPATIFIRSPQFQLQFNQITTVQRKSSTPTGSTYCVECGIFPGHHMVWTFKLGEKIPS